jgi:hypothetical protein
MARILSQVDVIRRGSVGGVTYLANQFHQIIARARTAPVQPQTNPQQDVRENLSFASAQWQGLTDLKREGWDDYSATCTYHGPISSYSVPGRSMFVSNLSFLNTNGRLATPLLIATVLDPPVIPGFAEVCQVDPPISPGIGKTGFSLKVYNLNIDDAVVFAWRSIAWLPTRNRFKGPWVASSLQGEMIAAAGNATFTFDGLTAGLAYFVYLRLITAEASPGCPHRISASRIIRAIAQVGV